MSLNVTIQDVPFAILEAVKARILAQRAQRQQQATPRAPSGPRPQFRRFGASSKAYRRPRPAALPDTGEIGFVLGPLAGYVNGELEVTADDLAPVKFSRHLTNDSLLGELLDFALTAGPASGTSALTNPDQAARPFGYLFASNYPAGSPVDMRTIVRYSGSSNLPTFYFWSADEDPANVVTLPSLENPDGAAGQYDSYSFEFMHRMAAAQLVVHVNGCSISLSKTNRLAIDLFLAGIDTVSVPFGSLNEDGHFELTLTNLPDADEEVPPEMPISDLPVGSWHHYALCKDGDSLRFYLDGQLMFSAVTVTDYWDLYAPIESAPFQYFYVKNGSLPIMCSLMITDNNDIGVSAVHGLRFTPQALYTGASFTPPTSITELA